MTKSTEVPDAFYQLQKKIASEQGYGNKDLSAEIKLRMAEVAIKEQRESLENWLDYFLSEDADYPMWLKYWSFNGLVKLGKYDPQTGTFGNRSKGLMTPFPDFNPEAFTQVVDVVLKKVQGESLKDIGDPAFLSLLETNNFGKLYGRALQIVTAQNADFSSIEGVWKVYPQKSDFKPLVNSLAGKNTGWCTAGTSTAQLQLSEGDFHVYYTKDKHGEYTSPRVAIRMGGKSIREIRGIGKNQNLDAGMAGSDILTEKLKEFGSAAQNYIKQSDQMKYLTEIQNKQFRGEQLTESQLKFLYELEMPIEGFGHKTDPRIQEIRNKRDIKNDLGLILNLNPSQIVLTLPEALAGKGDYFYGELNLNFVLSTKKINFIQTLGKIINTIRGEKSTDSFNGLTLTRSVYGNLFMNWLNSAEGLTLPKRVGGLFSMFRLKTITGLILPEYVGKNMNLSGLDSGRGLVLPKFVGGKIIDLSGLNSLDGVTLPDHFKGTIILSSSRVKISR